jgi:hypothetical protein
MMAGAVDVVEVRSAGEQFNVLRLCAMDEPATREVRNQHWGSCHLVEGFAKSPITIPVLDHRREVVPATAIGEDKELLVTAKEEFKQ